MADSVGERAATPAAKPKLLDQLRRALRSRHNDIRTAEELLGHKDMKTTMVYTHVLNRGAKGVRRPLDA